MLGSLVRHPPSARFTAEVKEFVRSTEVKRETQWPWWETKVAKFMWGSENYGLGQAGNK